MRKWCLTAVLCAVVLSACGSHHSTRSGGGGKKTIGVALIAPVGFLQDNIKRFEAELASKGFVSGKNVEYKSFNADGQLSNVNSIVTRLAQLHPDLVYLIGTPLVEGFAQKQTDVPVLFGAMTDPVGSKVIPSLTHPGGSITGTTDAVPAGMTIDLVTKTLPNAKRIGVIGNPSEENSASQIAAIKQQATEGGIDVVNRGVNGTGDVASAIRSLKGVQALIVPPDNTVFSALGTVVQTANQLHIPTFTTAGATNAKEGVMVALGADYDALGTQAGDLAAQILRGASPANLAVKGIFNGAPVQVAINLSTARADGVTIPPAVRHEARLFYGR